MPSLPKPTLEKLKAEFRTLPDTERAGFNYLWRSWARDPQKPPPGDWRFWLILAGRGFGKTRAGAEWIREQVEAGRRRLALIGPTAADVRDVMIEGESGILAVCPLDAMPVYQASRRRLKWPSGAMAFVYSAEEPERLRGPQHDGAWADELAAWKKPQEAWDQLQFGLRLGPDPRCVITTTPKPLPILRQLIADPAGIVTKGSTFENRAHVSSAFLNQIVRRYEGTRLGRQELHAELLLDAQGALWPYETILGCRAPSAPDLQRVVVAVDPSGSNGDDDGDLQGIVVVGLGVDGRGYVLADRSCQLSPQGWGRRAIEAFDAFAADRIVAEKNYGGEMVRFTLQAVRRTAPVVLVNASRGKMLRAEPVSALYEQGRISHVVADLADNPLADLEGEMRHATSSGYVGEGSPNRLDALVWALTDLFLTEPSAGAAFLELARRDLASEETAGVAPLAPDPAPGSLEWSRRREREGD